jgi:hypothetical protein
VPRHAGLSVPSVRELLARLLPEHSRPGALTVLARLPLTPNGKADRAALLALPAGRSVSGPAAEPGTPTERLVAGIWREVLGLPRIGVADNFFEIGGHSLSIVAVHARLAPHAGARLHVVDLFRYPTIRSIAAHLDGAGRAPGLDGAARRVAARTGRPRPVSAARHRTPAEKETP